MAAANMSLHCLIIFSWQAFFVLLYFTVTSLLSRAAIICEYSRLWLSLFFLFISFITVIPMSSWVFHRGALPHPPLQSSPGSLSGYGCSSSPHTVMHQSCMLRQSLKGLIDSMSLSNCVMKKVFKVKSVRSQDGDLQMLHNLSFRQKFGWLFHKT